MKFAGSIAVACACVFICGFAPVGASATQLLETNSKITSLCSRAADTLPKSIPAMRKTGRLLNEVRNDKSEFCFEQSGACSEYRFGFSGLKLHVLSTSKTKSAELLDIDITQPGWNFLGVSVGQPVSDLEREFGVRVPAHSTELAIGATCAPLLVEIVRDKITRLQLPCSACI